jgi:hypothetical protein
MFDVGKERLKNILPYINEFDLKRERYLWGNDLVALHV